MDKPADDPKKEQGNQKGREESREFGRVYPEYERGYGWEDSKYANSLPDRAWPDWKSYDEQLARGYEQVLPWNRYYGGGYRGGYGQGSYGGGYRGFTHIGPYGGSGYGLNYGVGRGYKVVIVETENNQEESPLEESSVINPRSILTEDDKVRAETFHSHQRELEAEARREWLRSVLAQGESENVEFKIGLPPDEVVAADLVGFANSNGGSLLIGIDDGGSLIGLNDDEVNEVIGHMHRLAESLFAWPTEIEEIRLDNKAVIAVHISPAPTYLSPIMTSSGQVYIRKESQSVKLEEAEVQDLLRGHRAVPRSGSKVCVVFVAMSFRDEEEPALVDYYRAMERAARRTKLPIRLMRIDRTEGDFEISRRIMEEIDRADIVLADFTLSPSNVYFEVGYARGQKKRIVQIARKGTNLEFDVRNWRTEFYRNATELEERLIPLLEAAYSDVATPEAAEMLDPAPKAARPKARRNRMDS